jgi:FkbM family methyltransferase
MNLRTLHEHTIDLDRLTPGGTVVDVGCRDFQFARAIAGWGCRVIALDPSLDVVPVGPMPGVTFLNIGLAARDGVVMFREEGLGSRIAAGGGRKVQVTSLTSLLARAGCKIFDAVKLDCEGAEYDILLNWPGPVARQISVEFHDVYRRDGYPPNLSEFYPHMFTHIGQWYKIAKHNITRTADGDSFWDSLFVMR